MADAYPWLEEIWLKRMVMTYVKLGTYSQVFKEFKILVLSSFEGFNTDGLVVIASNCRFAFVLNSSFRVFGFVVWRFVWCLRKLWNI